MSTPLRIVADDAIPHLQAAFGEVTCVPGPAIAPEHLREADVLLVRSVTRVDDALLDGSAVRFVGSATAGVDHIDQDALQRRGITFAHAPGCNARAVVEYVLAATLGVGALRGPIGVVGYGQIGRRLATALRRLGFEVLVCDPPRAEAGYADADYQPLSALLGACAVLTLHVPKVTEGPHITAGLLGAEQLAQLPAGALVINTCRGDVVDNRALLAWLEAGHGTAMLDVWEAEPALYWPLLEHPRLLLGTPHIAGYTQEGKTRGTAMVHAALMQWLGQPPRFQASDVLAPGGGLPEQASEADVLQLVHPLADTGHALRRLLARPEPERPAAFEALRRSYLFRRELTAFTEVPPALRLWAALSGL